jgi:hypothetical protein
VYALSHNHVPFVDVMNTMFDASLPLTVAEYEEWGKPMLPRVQVEVPSTQRIQLLVRPALHTQILSTPPTPLNPTNQTK